MYWTVLGRYHLLYWLWQLRREIGSRFFPQNIPIRQFDTAPTQSCAVTTIELAYVAGGFSVFFPFVIRKVAAARKLNRRRTRFHWVISKGFFRNAPRLCFKAKLSAKLMVWKWCYVLTQIKLVFTRKILHLAAYRKEQSGLTDDLAYPDSGNGLV